MRRRRFVTTVAVTMPEDDGTPRRSHAKQERTRCRYTTASASGAAKHAKVVERTEFQEPSDAADAVIVDSTDAEGAGGTGETTDWEAAARFVDETALPVVLAGGLEPSNAADAVSQVEPYAVDVSSGVERNETKDDVLVESFVREVRDAGV